MKKRLSAEDVRQLADDRSAEQRAGTAAKVALSYEGALNETERRLAEDIFRVLLEDAEVRVRAGLAEALKSNPAIPRDIARALACDVSAVAVPMLQFSAALLDEDLIAIVKSRPTAQRLAVAGRRQVPTAVCPALIDTAEREVVAALVGNDGAELEEGQLSTVLESFADDPAITTPMAYRRILPMAVAERLVTLVSENLRDHLASHHQLPDDLAARLVLESRERAVLGLLDGGAERGDVLELVERLARNGRLTVSLTLRALCAGDLVFFETALARLANVPAVNAFQLLRDSGQAGLRALAGKAGFSENGYRLCRAALDIARELQSGAGDIDRSRFAERMATAVLTKFGDTLSEAESHFMLGLLGAHHLERPKATLH